MLHRIFAVLLVSVATSAIAIASMPDSAAAFPPCDENQENCAPDETVSGSGR